MWRQGDFKGESRFSFVVSLNSVYQETHQDSSKFYTPASNTAVSLFRIVVNVRIHIQADGYSAPKLCSVSATSLRNKWHARYCRSWSWKNQSGSLQVCKRAVSLFSVILVALLWIEIFWKTWRCTSKMPWKWSRKKSVEWRNENTCVSRWSASSNCSPIERSFVIGKINWMSVIARNHLSCSYLNEADTKRSSSQVFHEYLQGGLSYLDLENEKDSDLIQKIRQCFARFVYKFINQIPRECSFVAHWIRLSVLFCKMPFGNRSFHRTFATVSSICFANGAATWISWQFSLERGKPKHRFPSWSNDVCFYAVIPENNRSNQSRAVN